MSPRSHLTTLLLASPAFAGLAACVTPTVDDAHVSTTGDDALVSVNGLSSINGLSSFNGLNSLNGLNSFNGLNSVNGLANGVGLMSSSNGRTTLSYIVKCALPAGHSISKKDQNNASYTFAGQIGVAPEWEASSCGTDCQERVSACVLAHVNTTGKHIQLWLDSDAPSIGWGRSTDYPYQEGSFFGNIFESPPRPTTATALISIRPRCRAGWAPGSRAHPTRTRAEPAALAATAGANAPAPTLPTTATVTKRAAHTDMSSPCGATSNPNTDTTRSATAGRASAWTSTTSAATTGLASTSGTTGGGANQKWRIKQVSPGKYTLTSVNSGRVLDIYGGSPANGAQLIQWGANGGSNQQWSFKPTGDGYYQFSPGSRPSASIEVPNGTSALGAYVQAVGLLLGRLPMWTVLPAN